MRKFEQQKNKIAKVDQHFDRYHDNQIKQKQYQNYKKNEIICQNIEQTLDFINDYHNIKSITKINRDINSHKILCIDTKIFKQLQQISEQYESANDEKGICLRQRSVKLLDYFYQIEKFSYQKQFSKNLNHKFELTKLLEINNRELKSNSTKTQIKFGRKSQIPIRKNQPNSKNQSNQIKSQFIHEFISHRKDKNQVEQTEDQHKENNPHLANRYSNFNQCRKNNNNDQSENTKTKKILTISPMKIINIHEILKSAKEQRSNDSQKQRLNQQFKQKIQRSITQINRQLRQIKEKQTYNQQSLSDMKIQQLQNQIKILNKKNPHISTSSHLNTIKTIKLDLSRKKKESRKTPQKSIQDTRNSMSREKKMNKSQITIRTQIIQKKSHKSNLSTIQNKTHSGNNNNKSNVSDVSKDKTPQIKNNQLQTNMKKINESASQKVIPVKKKLLLTARIAQIARN